MNWKRIWLWVVLIPAATWWGGWEAYSIVYDHGYVADTLSDTIRDWQQLHPWLSGVVGITFAGLWAHFFLQKNSSAP